MSYLNEMENQGIILKGRVVRSEFDSVDTIKVAAAFVDKWAVKTGLPLSFVYCGTIINWPDDFDFTPCVIGLVLADTYEEEASDGSTIPTEFPREQLLTDKSIPDEFWEELKSIGVKMEGYEDLTLLTVAGWAWVRLTDGGEIEEGVSTEDDCYTVLDLEALSSGKGPLSLSAGYC